MIMWILVGAVAFIVLFVIIKLLIGAFGNKKVTKKQERAIKIIALVIKVLGTLIIGTVLVAVILEFLK